MMEPASTATRKKLFLLDAYALIYRAYYAFIKTPRYNSKGVNTSAILGFVNTLEDVLRREQPSHIAVVFDPSGPTFRHEAFEHYKANRQETPEDIRKAVPIIKDIVDAYRIPAIQIAGFEADDVIGTLAKKAAAEDFDVYMMTPDKDYGQLVSEHIFIYRPKHTGGFEIMGAEEVKAKFDLDSHEQVIDLLGLMGDASDNIPGCPGVGEKWAVKLLKEFGSIQNLLENTDKLTGSIKDKIENNKKQIEFSRFLATIKIDVPVELNEEDLKIEDPDEEKLTALFADLEFRTLLARRNVSTVQAPISKSTVQDFAQQTSLFGDVNPETHEIEVITPQYSHLASIATTPHQYRAVVTFEERTLLLNTLMQQCSVCFDTETDSLDVFTAKLVGMSFAWQEGEAFYVPVPSDINEAQQLVDDFKPFFLNETIEKIGQNMKFDLLILSNYGVKIKGPIFDTMIAHYLLQPELRHNMDYLAEIMLVYKTIHIDELIGPKGKNQLTMRQVPLEKITDYAAEDADITFKLKQLLAPKIKENGLESLFFDVEMPLMRVLAEMEQNGVLIDDVALKQSSEVLTDEMLNIEKEVHAMTGIEFNISSAKQVGEVLFERMKIVEKAKKTKSGQYSTNEDVLESLRGKHPVVDKILEYRGLKKLLSTYIDALPALINQKTGKIHTSFNQTVAATGRLSSSNPNLQNIPIRDEQGKEIRKAFIAEPDCYFLSADYSQIELRIMAHLSQDENMIDAFKSGYDIHAATAAKIYHLPIDQVTSDMRRKAKTANFGIIYGISVFGLSDRLRIPRGEAKELIDGYFDTYPQVRAYMDYCIQNAKVNGWVETLLHRKRYLPDINSHNANVRGFAERNAINAPIQGTAADIIKIAMVRISRRFQEKQLRSKMILQVHDELNFNVVHNELEIVKSIIIQEMESALSLSVPLKVDVGVGQNWLEAH
ncbi:DNA polymerase I [Microbacter margulisiae]|uniref:DNA polymerase I n=1 Tax=Microbacter margulisiae TaxID=1350067 RepID=A0A7W5H3N8_9PORP|nr:DNA polymerase I [Microbacter margulisiae]MBB3188552.1 DNA polymerase-1 [Microbacter margulisiae]